jgi:predicted NUDIX family NTP pyrophosphohydrolase
LRTIVHIDRLLPETRVYEHDRAHESGMPARRLSDGYGARMVRSAGLLLYRRGAEGRLEVMLGHMGGPYWDRKDVAAWSIPKGQREEGEEPIETARREFEEEIGQPPPDGEAVSLGDVRQSGGRKVVEAWAIEGDLDVSEIESTPFAMEWPPRSGKLREFPEFDRAAWFAVDDARGRLVKAQVAFLDRLVELVAV